MSYSLQTSALNRISRVGRPSRESAEELREQLLETALEIFLAVGYEAASLNKIAQASGVSRDTIYRQYKSKAALFRASTTKAFDHMSERLRSAIDLAQPPEKVLREVIMQIQQGAGDSLRNQVIRLVITEASRHSDVASDVMEGAKAFLRPLTEYLDHQKRRGVLVMQDAEEAALFLSSVAAGAGRFFIGPPVMTSGEGDAWCEELLSRILYGLKGARTKTEDRTEVV